MFHTTALAMLLPVLGAPTATDVGAGVDMRDSVGLVPQQQGEAARLTNLLDLTALSGLLVKSQRTSFSLRYTPRLSFQEPNPVSLLRPLLLHQTFATVETALSRRTTLTAGSQFSRGDVSYANQGDVLDDGSTVVNSPTSRIMRTRANASLSYAVSRTNTLGWSATGGHQTSVFKSGEDRALGLPPSLDLTASMQDSLQLTSLDGLSFTASFSYLRRLSEEDKLSISTANASVGWARQLSENSQLVTNLGGSISSNSLTKQITLFPTATAQHATSFAWLRTRWTQSSAVSLQGFVDPATATFRPLANLTWSLTTDINDRWTIGPGLVFSTSATREPLVPQAYESSGRLELPVSYRLPSHFSLDFGVRASTRNGHLTQLGSPRSQQDFRAFVGLRYVNGTGASHGEWL